MNKKSVISFAIGMLVAGSALAQGPWYGGVELGAASIENRAQELANALVRTNGGSASVVQDTGIGFGRIFGGYNINKYVSAELGYLNSGDANATFSGSSGGSYSGVITLNISGLDASAIIRPVPDSAAKGLFLRAGVTSYKQTLSYSCVNATCTNSSDSGMGNAFGVGYDLPMGPGDWRFQLTSLTKVAGVSNNDSTAFSVGYLWKF